MSQASASPTDPLAEALALARTHERERYLSALLAPREVRRPLLLFAAWSAELTSIVARAKDPMLGEIRLQWWRDALRAPPSGRTGHPLADAVRELIVERGLPVGLLEGMIDARQRGLWREPIADEAQLVAWAVRSEGALLSLAARLVLGPPEDAIEAAARRAGTAIAIAAGLLDLPRSHAEGVSLVPVTLARRHEDAERALEEGRVSAGLVAAVGELVERARAAEAEALALLGRRERRLAIAFLPLALVRGRLADLARLRPGPVVDWPRRRPLREMLRLAFAERRGFVPR